MRAECRTHGVDALDIMGPILERLTVHLKLAPQEKPGLFQDLTEAKTREIEAVSFAFRHDDGQNTQDLDRAEVVLVGVSRAMKTPTMLYMAYRGWFAANVPLVPGLPPPDALLAVPSDRVFCLVMSPERLQQLRRVRAEEDVDSAASLRFARSDSRRAVLRRGTLPQAPLASHRHDRQVGRRGRPRNHRMARRKRSRATCREGDGHVVAGNLHIRENALDNLLRPLRTLHFAAAGEMITAAPPPGARWSVSLSPAFTPFLLMLTLVPTLSASAPSAKICASYSPSPRKLKRNLQVAGVPIRHGPDVPRCSRFAGRSR